MILLLTRPSDDHADLIEPILRRRGAHVVRLDPADFAGRSTLSVTVDRDGTIAAEVREPHRVIDLMAVTATWIRRPSRPAGQPGMTAHHTSFVAAEWSDMCSSVFALLDGTIVPGSYAAMAHAGNKYVQLRLAAALGFTIPSTMSTNDPDRLIEFWNAEHPLISKQVGNTQLIAGPEPDQFAARYTQPVTHRDLRAAESLRLCPVTVQPMIDKAFELRVTVVGDRTFTALIDSQATHHTNGDWRRYDDTRCRTLPFDLEPDISARCTELVRRLGLRYGAIDLIGTPDGGYVFLEVNPSGQYGWIEQLTGLPITEAIADELIGTSARTLQGTP